MIGKLPDITKLVRVLPSFIVVPGNTMGKKPVVVVVGEIVNDPPNTSNLTYDEEHAILLVKAKEKYTT